MLSTAFPTEINADYHLLFINLGQQIARMLCSTEAIGFNFIAQAKDLRTSCMLEIPTRSYCIAALASGP